MGISGGAMKVLSVELTGTNPGLKAMLSDSSRAIRAFKKENEDSNKSLFSKQNVMKGVAGGALALAGGLAYAVSKAVAFDKAMRNVNSLSGLNEKQLGALEKQVISLSKAVPQSATTLAEGLYDIASSGFQGADGLKVLDAAAKSASAGITTTAVSARAITGVLNAYGLQAKDAADVSDVLFSTVNLGVISFDELANNLGDVVGSAAAAKISIDQVGAAIATMTLSGIKGSQATTSLSSLTTKLVQPSTALAKLYDQLGYKSGAAALAQKGLRGVMEDVRKATGGNITSMLALFPDIEAARGALALMANDGANYAKVSDQITDKTKRQGATQKVLNEQMKAVSNQWQVFTNGIDAAAISIGVKLLPRISDAMKYTQNMGAAIVMVAQDIGDKASSGFADLGDAGQNIVDVLKSIGQIALTVAEPLGKLAGGAVLSTFLVLADVLAKVTGFMADNQTAVIALGLAYAVHATGGIKSLTDGMGIVSDALRGKFTPGMYNAAEAALGLGDKAKAAGRQLLAMAPALAVGATLAVAVTAWAAYSKAADEAGQITKQTQAVMSSFKTDELQSALKKAQDFINDYNQRLDDVGHSNSLAGAAADVANFQKNWETLGMGDNVEKVQADADKISERMGQLQYNTVELFKVMGKPLPDAAKWINDVQGANGALAQAAAMKQMQSVLDTLGPKLKAAGVDLGAAWNVQQMTNAYAALDSVKDGSEAAAGAQQNLVDEMGNASAAMDDAKTKADKLKTALDGLMGASIGVDEANIAWLNGLSTLGGELEKNTKTIKGNKSALDSSTQGGRDNRTAIIDRVKALQDMLVAGANAGDGTDTLTAKLAQGREALIRSGAAAKIPREEMVKLLAQYKLTPDLVETLIKENGGAGVAEIMKKVKADADKLGKAKPTPTVTARDLATPRLTSIQNRLDAIDGRNASASVTVTENTYKNMIETTSHRDVGIRVGANGIFPSFANGKLPDQAMIEKGRPGGLVQWAESETQDEAFIPMAQSKRGRSEKILSTVADRFGMSLVKMASGGFRYPAFSFKGEPYKADKTRTKAQQAADYKSWQWHRGQDRSAAYATWIDNRRAAAQEYKDRIRLSDVASGRRDAGVFTPGRDAGGTLSNLDTVKEARAQALAELRSRQSADPHDTAEDFYKKPITTLKEYTSVLKSSEVAQRQWGVDMRKVSSTVGADVVKSLQGMGEQGEALIKKLARGSVADMKAMADQIRKINFADFTNETIQDVTGQQQFQANLQALVKMGRSDLAAHFQQMGYESAAGLAAQAVKTPGASLAALANVVNQQDALNDPNAQKAYDLARILQGSGGKLGIIGLASASGMSVGDVMGLLQTYNGSVFSKLPASATKQLSADQALLKAGKQPSGFAMGAILRGSDTGYHWGEKSSGGESLIPHAMDRRSRALNLWKQTGRILGAAPYSGAGGGVTIAAGAITVPIHINQTDASAQDIEAAVQRGTADMMSQLSRLLTTGRRG